MQRSRDTRGSPGRSRAPQFGAERSSGVPHAGSYDQETVTWPQGTVPGRALSTSSQLLLGGGMGY